jgi:hypothetical protein
LPRGRNAITHTNRNFVLAYIFLVGLPLLGLVAVLKSGRGLAAPYSVDGAWKIDAPVDHPSSSACGNLLSSFASAPLSISQSGKTLVVTMSGGTKTTTGTLEGKTLKAQFAAAGNVGTADCGDSGITLAATLDPAAEPRTLRGTLAAAGCASCAPLEFRAVRQSKTPGGTR